VKRQAVILLVLILAAAAINVPAAMLMMPWLRNPLQGRKFDVESPAVNRSWPVATPHPQPWPAVTLWMEGRWFGVTFIDAKHTENGDAPGQLQSTHAVNVIAAGWPLRCIAHVQYRWVWHDPALQIPHAQERADPGLVLRPVGLVLNPIIVGGGLWLLLFGVPIGWRRLRGRRRRKQGACPACGYDLRGATSTLCPECGAAHPSAPAGSLPAAPLPTTG
jgi:hypothetical protein